MPPAVKLHPRYRAELIEIMRALATMPAGEREEWAEMVHELAEAEKPPGATVRILGNLEAFRNAFPGIAARPDVFLQNVHSVVLMAALEIVWRANESGALEQAIAFGTWLRESV